MLPPSGHFGNLFLRKEESFSFLHETLYMGTVTFI